MKNIYLVILFFSILPVKINSELCTIECPCTRHFSSYEVDDCAKCTSPGGGGCCNALCSDSM